jgi:hypothetical protein
MDATLRALDLLVLLCSLGVLGNTLLIAMIWWRQEARGGHIERLDGRVQVLESHVSTVADIRGRMNQMGEELSAISERTETTQEMVHSIQDYLRGGGK